MALTVTIKFDDKDIYTTYDLTILNISDMGSPKIPNNVSAYAGRPGLTRGVGSPQAKVLKLTGEIKATSHANLLTAIDNIKKATYYGYHGLHKFRLNLTDWTDRYFLAWCADIKVDIPNPWYIVDFCAIEITLVIDDPFGIYNTYTFSNLPGSPFSSPYSCFFNYQGTAETRPRILCHNDGAGAITSLEILNLAVRGREKLITVTTTGLKRAAGRWGDIKGSIFFDGAGSSYFTTKGNFNPGYFTVFGFIKWIVGATNTPGYFFSTTGDIVKCYYDLGNTKWVFDINGSTVEITNATSGFTHTEWWAIKCSYDGNIMKLELYDIEDTETAFKAELGSVTYRGLPTNTYIGTNASLANFGDKYLDEMRFYNYSISTTLITDLETMTAPLPMGKGCTAYFPFDYKANGIGWQNTSLLIAADSMSQYDMYEINCEKMTVETFAAAVTAAGTDIMDKVSGEFPVLVPGYNAIQVVHDGSASGLSIAVEDKRRFL